MNDTSWIFSSIIQSTAAFVAIVGGFITGTVLQHITRRNGIVDEITEAEAELAHVRGLRANAVVERDRSLIRDRLSDETERIVRSWSQFQTVEQATEQLNLHGFSRDAIAEEWSAFSRRIHRFRMAIESGIESNGARQPFFDKWLKEANLPGILADSWEAKLVFLHAREVWLANINTEGPVSLE